MDKRASVEEIDKASKRESRTKMNNTKCTHISVEEKKKASHRVIDE